MSPNLLIKFIFTNCQCLSQQSNTSITKNILASFYLNRNLLRPSNSLHDWEEELNHVTKAQQNLSLCMFLLNFFLYF